MNRKPAISSEHLEAETSLLPKVIAEVVLAERCPHITAEQYTWFVEHVDFRTRYCYANNPHFRKSLRNDAGRDTLYAFVRHWLAGYELDPEDYQRKHAEP